MKLEELKDKKILILGFGKEGQDSCFALKKLFKSKVFVQKIRDKTLAIADQQCLGIGFPNIEIPFFCGKDYLRRVGECEVVIKTPGIQIAKLKLFLKKNTKVTSQTKLFFDNFKGIVIGVTGTKGKGTVASLIYHILKKAGKKVELVGNIGKPVLGVLLKKKEQGRNWIFVYELSSHQLQNLKKSPHIAVFTNLFSDHLDYYKNLKQYQEAKANITKYQGKNDLFIFNANDVKLRRMAKTTKAVKRPVTGQNMAFKSHLKGGFNQLNIALAREVVQSFNVKQSIIKQVVQTFKGLPHRLEFIGKYKGIEFYNDSMSTIPEVSIAALKALKNITCLIAGGSEKGSDYKKLAQEILKSKVNNLIILGQGTGQKIKKLIKESRVKNKPNKPVIFETSSMKQAVKIAFDRTNRGEVCLLSPGAASFNLFKNYQQRGDLFKKWVQYYGQNK